MHENLNQDKYAANILRTGEMKLFSNLKHVIMVQIGSKQARSKLIDKACDRN